MSVINFNDLQTYARGEEVEIHGFTPEDGITVRLSRPSLMKLAGTGEIPNMLLSAANTLFSGGISGILSGEGKSLADTYKVMECVAKASLLEPTFEDFERAGVALTDSQLIDIFTYSQSGVRLFDTFRKNRENTEPDRNGAALQEETE